MGTGSAAAGGENTARLLFEISAAWDSHSLVLTSADFVLSLPQDWGCPRTQCRALPGRTSSTSPHSKLARRDLQSVFIHAPDLQSGVVVCLNSRSFLVTIGLKLRMEEQVPNKSSGSGWRFPRPRVSLG